MMLFLVSVTDILICVVLGLLLAYAFLKKPNQTRALPPGPRALPIIGNLHNIIQDGGAMEFYKNKQEIYGNVYSIELGGIKYVVISGYKNLKYLLVKKGKMTYRRNIGLMPPSYDIHDMKSRPGIMFDSDFQMRQQAVRFLHDQGLGKTPMESTILEEAERFCEHFIEPQLGKEINLSSCMDLTTSNIIFSVIVGHRFDYDHPQFISMNAKMKILFETNMLAIMSKNIPLASWLPGDPFKHRLNSQSLGDTMDYFDKVVAERRQLQRTNCSTGTFVDKILEPSSANEDLNETQLDRTTSTTIMQFFGGGTDTTAYSINWAILYLCLNPEIQSKVQEEIDAVLGDHVPSYTDRTLMPYTEAVMLETLRCSMVLPTLLPHTLDETLEIEGQEIAAGTELIFNLQSVYNDSEVFEKPETFNPERFLSGDIQQKRAYVSVSFGLGKRSCPGEVLAKMEIFLFLCIMLQKYTVRYGGNSPPTSKGICGTLNIPAPYSTIWLPRKEKT